VFIPEEIRKNKLAPKAEYMTYLGNAEGSKAYLFMQITNRLFTGTTATFDETNFPRSKSQRRVHTCIRKDAEEPSNNDPTFLDDDDESPTFPKRVPILSRENERSDQAPPQDKPAAESEGEQEQPPVPQPRRSDCLRNTTTQPGNVYGEKRNPSQIEKDNKSMRSWRKIVGEKPKVPLTQAKDQ